LYIAGGLSWQWAKSGWVPQLGVWTHVAGSWGNPGSYAIRIYVNGVSRGNNSYSGPAPTVITHNVIGRSSYVNTGVPVVIDELSVYNRALAAEELYQIWKLGTLGQGKCAPK
jgi:hypothetical protein